LDATRKTAKDSNHPQKESRGCGGRRGMNSAWTFLRLYNETSSNNRGSKGRSVGSITRIGFGPDEGRFP
jgi:hypothetical protein